MAPVRLQVRCGWLMGKRTCRRSLGILGHPATPERNAWMKRKPSRERMAIELWTGGKWVERIIPQAIRSEVK